MSAGTGKTVRAWYLLLKLSQEGIKVGFIAPNSSILKVSEDQLKKLTKNVQTETYFSVPTDDKHQWVMPDHGRSLLNLKSVKLVFFSIAVDRKCASGKVPIPPHADYKNLPGMN